MQRLKALNLVQGLQRLCEEVLCVQAQRVDCAEDFMLIGALWATHGEHSSCVTGG